MIKAQSGGSTQRELIPSGTHVARCYSMVHVGTVQWEYNGEVKHTDKVRLTWELPNETKVFKEENGEQPFVISKEYTLSMHEKSNMRKDLESWRGKAFTEGECENFDITNLLGVVCQLSIVHKKATNGNVYDNVGSVVTLMKGVECPAQVNPTFEFNYDDKFDLNWLREQPDFIKEMIQSTPEYKGRIKELEAAEGLKQMDAALSNTVHEDLPVGNLPDIDPIF